MLPGKQPKNGTENLNTLPKKTTKTTKINKQNNDDHMIKMNQKKNIIIQTTNAQKKIFFFENFICHILLQLY